MLLWQLTRPHGFSKCQIAHCAARLARGDQSNASNEMVGEEEGRKTIGI